MKLELHWDSKLKVWNITASEDEIKVCYKCTDDTTIEKIYSDLSNKMANEYLDKNSPWM